MFQPTEGFGIDENEGWFTVPVWKIHFGVVSADVGGEVVEVFMRIDDAEIGSVVPEFALTKGLGIGTFDRVHQVR